MTIDDIYSKYEFDDENLEYEEEDGHIISLSFSVEYDEISRETKDEILGIVSQFKFLKDLSIDVDDYCFTDLSALSCLHNLEHLTIYSDTQISDLSFLESINNLHTFYLHSSNITTIEELYKYKNLEALEVTNAQITDVSKVHTFTSLKYLNLSGNRIKDLGDKPFSQHLTSVTLSDNEIKNIAPLQSCIHLTSVNLNNNLIDSIHPLTASRALTDLRVGNNQITDLEYLRCFKQLSVLDIAGNAVEHISMLEDITNLSRLFLENNEINNLAVLENHHKLRKLNVANNAIEDLSVINASKLTLTHLNCSKNPILSFAVLENMQVLNDLDASYIPLENKTITLPIRLEILNLSHCSLNSLANVKSLDRIKRLDLSHNKFTEITGECRSLGLQSLNLYNNNINQPINTYYFKKIGIIDLRNNPFGNCFLSDYDTLQWDLRFFNLFRIDTVIADEHILEWEEYYELALHYFLDKKDKDTAWIYLLKMFYSPIELDDLKLVMYIDKLKQTPDGAYPYIKFYLYQIITEVIHLTDKYTYFSDEHKQVVVDKINTIPKLNLRNALLSTINGKERWMDVFENDPFPGYEFICRNQEDILPEFKADYFYYLGLGSCNNNNNTIAIAEEYIETSLYCLNQLHLIHSPLFEILYDKIYRVLSTSSKRYDKTYRDQFVGYNTIFNTICNVSVRPPIRYDYSGFIDYKIHHGLSGKLNLFYENKKNTVEVQRFQHLNSNGSSYFERKRYRKSLKSPSSDSIQNESTSNVKPYGPDLNSKQNKRAVYVGHYSPYSEFDLDIYSVLGILFFVLLIFLQFSRFFTGILSALGLES